MNPMVEPRATRPYMPGYGIQDAGDGLGLLPWSWATERLEASRNYWLATTRPDGRPHAMPVWGVWVQGQLHFSTGLQSRKARNLALNPHCVVCVEQDEDAVVVEGIVSSMTQTDLRQKVDVAYAEKYGWDIAGSAEPVFSVHPTVVFGFGSGNDEFTGSATRWLFGESL